MTKTVAAKAGGDGVLDGYLSRTEVAAALGVSVDTLTRWGTQRVGPASVMIGRKRYYRRAAIEEWLRSREQPAVGARARR